MDNGSNKTNDGYRNAGLTILITIIGLFVLFAIIFVIWYFVTGQNLGSEGSTCSKDSDCSNGFYCSGENTCHAGNSGVPEGEPCQVSQNCEVGLTCITGTCQTPSTAIMSLTQLLTTTATTAAVAATTTPPTTAPTSSSTTPASSQNTTSSVSFYSSSSMSSTTANSTSTTTTNTTTTTTANLTPIGSFSNMLIVTKMRNKKPRYLSYTSNGFNWSETPSELFSYSAAQGALYTGSNSITILSDGSTEIGPASVFRFYKTSTGAVMITDGNCNSNNNVGNKLGIGVGKYFPIAGFYNKADYPNTPDDLVSSESKSTSTGTWYPVFVSLEPQESLQC